MKLLFIFLVTLVSTSCLTRAPSDYELDRRAGFTPPGATGDRSGLELQNLGVIKSETKPPLVPVRRPARIEKIWVFDQTIDNRVLQHTWLFVEVDKGGWTTSEPVPAAVQENKISSESKNRK